MATLVDILGGEIREAKRHGIIHVTLFAMLLWIAFHEDWSEYSGSKAMTFVYLLYSVFGIVYNIVKADSAQRELKRLIE